MENRRSAALVILIIAIIAIIFLIWVMFSNQNNGMIPWPDGNNGGPQIERTEWAFEITQIKDLNDEGYYGADVIIGIVDSGIDLTHTDLDHINVTAWVDYVKEEQEPYDDNGHGTHIAGIIAAQGEIDGIAPKVEMVVVKAISYDGSGSDSDVARGVDFCVDHGADVICLSLGGRARKFNIGDETANACEDAIAQGVFVVAAAGNDGDDPKDKDVESPATVEKVIAVGAVDENKVIASFSSIGDNDGVTPFPFDDRKDPDKKPELVAPGVDIVSTWPNEKYAEASGTSQSTAFVAGCIVLLLDAHPEYQRAGSNGGNVNTITQIKNIFMNTAEKCPGQKTPHDDYYGYGLINVKDAEGAL